jgi:glycosyltransferase involved in cell wall biosynthesis
MKISVLIPAYNASRTIRATVESVLGQSVPPDEILVMDDGSTDDTGSILQSYSPRVTTLQQANGGVASARNELVARARGDLIAFLDADDIWHPRYLEVQQKTASEHPNAVAFFTGYQNLNGYGDCDWGDRAAAEPRAAVLEPLRFLETYHKVAGSFRSPSFCCVPKTVLNKMATAFPVEISSSDDFYFMLMLPLLGPVVYDPSPFAAYRTTFQGLSSQRLKLTGLAVRAMELVEERYRKLPDARLSEAFGTFFASKRREYAKVLMGAGKTAEARKQIWNSLRNAPVVSSISKSLLWLLLTYMPGPAQPKWPKPQHREKEFTVK